MMLFECTEEYEDTQKKGVQDSFEGHPRFCEQYYSSKEKAHCANYTRLVSMGSIVTKAKGGAIIA